jgi:hypothetical protein
MMIGWSIENQLGRCTAFVVAETLWVIPFRSSVLLPVGVFAVDISFDVTTQPILFPPSNISLVAIVGTTSIRRAIHNGTTVDAIVFLRVALEQ